MGIDLLDEFRGQIDLESKTISFPLLVGRPFLRIMNEETIKQPESEIHAMNSIRNLVNDTEVIKEGIRMKMAVQTLGGVPTAVVRLTQADARSLLGIGRLRVGWVNCRIREHVEVARCFRCQGYGHVSRDCILPGRKQQQACWRSGVASHVVKECKAPLGA